MKERGENRRACSETRPPRQRRSAPTFHHVPRNQPLRRGEPAGPRHWSPSCHGDREHQHWLPPPPPRPPLQRGGTTTGEPGQLTGATETGSTAKERVPRHKPSQLKHSGRFTPPARGGGGGWAPSPETTPPQFTTLRKSQWGGGGSVGQRTVQSAAVFDHVEWTPLAPAMFGSHSGPTGVRLYFSPRTTTTVCVG